MKYFELEALPYPDHALEPIISRETVTFLFSIQKCNMRLIAS